ncbi:MAG: hypothetical protein JNK15_23280 [Planctomycetes bacterium]|nr:hypothetical protein [Planctomycetota bacterium]
MTTTVTVTEAGVMPLADVRIPAFSTVVWRNAASVPLRIAIDAAACPDCETVLGFAGSAAGAHAAAVAPGQVATLCFHDAGTFPFVLQLGGREHRGTIVVEGER